MSSSSVAEPPVDSPGLFQLPGLGCAMFHGPESSSRPFAALRGGLLQQLGVCK